MFTALLSGSSPLLLLISLSLTNVQASPTHISTLYPLLAYHHRCYISVCYVLDLTFVLLYECITSSCTIGQWFPKYGTQEPKQGLRRVKKWVAQKRFKPGLYLFNVTTACCVCVYHKYMRKELIADNVPELSNLLPKIIYTSDSQTVVRVPLVVREGFSGGTRAAFLSYLKIFVNSFLCFNSFVCYANVANSFICCINLKYIGANNVLLKPRVYTPTLKKHQAVRDLKKFENHWSIQSIHFSY